MGDEFTLEERRAEADHEYAPTAHADSYWTGLMPKILLATLYRKVRVLRHLA
jgi:hypothetical protein